MNQRQEIIERLKALELEGGSHQMLSDICRAVSPGAQFGWTQGACDGLRLRLISFLGETDEDALREAYMKGRNDGFDRGFASADDWLAEHEDAMNEHGWTRLPVDADGEPIHVGDKLVDKDSKLPKPAIVKCILYNDEGCVVSNLDPHGCWYDPSLLRHHAPTVEDVLREMLDAWGEMPSNMTNEAIVAEYASKLRGLAGDAE